jgi:probable phosphoglycerate mutase
VELIGSWQDEYTVLGDRLAQKPLQLPHIATQKRVTLVRHGQSTWNAESRVQGSSNFSVLTEKGVRQAKATAEMVNID